MIILTGHEGFIGKKFLEKLTGKEVIKVPTKNLSTVANGLFPKMKNVILDRSFRKGKSIKDVDIRKCLVSAQYDPIVFQTYPEFFTPQNTIMNFMS